MRRLEQLLWKLAALQGESSSVKDRVKLQEVYFLAQNYISLIQLSGKAEFQSCSVQLSSIKSVLMHLKRADVNFYAERGAKLKAKAAAFLKNVLTLVEHSSDLEEYSTDRVAKILLSAFEFALLSTLHRSTRLNLLTKAFSIFQQLMKKLWTQQLTSLKARGQFSSIFPPSGSVDKKKVLELEQDFHPHVQTLLKLLRFEEMPVQHKYLRAILVNSRKRALSRKVDMVASMLQAFSLYIKSIKSSKSEKVVEKENSKDSESAEVVELQSEMAFKFVGTILA